MKITKNKLLKNGIARNIIKFLYKEDRKHHKRFIQDVRLQILQTKILTDMIIAEAKCEQELIKSLEQKTDRELLLFCAENQIIKKRRYLW